jgi:hypothetical protein
MTTTATRTAELTEYLGLATIYGFLAATAPFRAAASPRTVT